MKLHAVRLVGCLVILLVASNAWGWGRDGHYLIARLALTSLPADMPKFFIDATSEFEFLSPEPDVWRDRVEQELGIGLDRGHNPDHIFKFELYSPEVLPLDRYSFIETLNEEGIPVRLVGMLPYRAMELFQRTRVSWRRWHQTSDPQERRFLEARIIQDAGLLQHYIGDSAQPHHMSVNRNGWELPDNPRGYTTDNTLHRRFESDFVKAHIRPDHVQPLIRSMQVVDDGLAYIYAHMRRSWERITELYELELKQPFGAEHATPEATTFVATRLADAVSTLRDLWYTAYVTSKPAAESRR